MREKVGKCRSRGLMPARRKYIAHNGHWVPDGPSGICAGRSVEAMLDAAATLDGWTRARPSYVDEIVCRVVPGTSLILTMRYQKAISRVLDRVLARRDENGQRIFREQPIVFDYVHPPLDLVQELVRALQARAAWEPKPKQKDPKVLTRPKAPPESVPDEAVRVNMARN